MNVHALLLALAVLGTNTDKTLPVSATSVPLSVLVNLDSARKDWHDDFALSVREAARLGLPMVLHFHAEWCGPCQKMEHEVLHTDAVQAALGVRVVGTLIDVDRNPELVSRFGVEALPSDIYIGADGRIVDRAHGFASAGSWLERLNHGGLAAAAPVIGAKQGPLDQQPATAVADAAEPEKCVIERKDGCIVGLGGFSPVALARSKSWTPGRHEFSCLFKNIHYYMTSQAELDAFEADPEKFAPRLHGCDPVVLASQDRILPGSIRLGAYFEGGIYFFGSEASRRLFKQSPASFVDATPGGGASFEFDLDRQQRQIQ